MTRCMVGSAVLTARCLTSLLLCDIIGAVEAGCKVQTTLFTNTLYSKSFIVFVHAVLFLLIKCCLLKLIKLVINGTISLYICISYCVITFILFQLVSQHSINK